jgi:type I restriction enzyme S subunit
VNPVKQETKKVPLIRFKKFTGNWEQQRLGDVSIRVHGNDGRMDLPTLTISAANGWMDQEDRFSGNIAGKEQKNYTLLHKGELSYNHGNSKIKKYGAVFSLQSYEEALVPRVYHSFKITNGDADFIEYYFATGNLDRELAKLISSGARMDGLLNISYDEFMGIKLSLPSINEQKEISKYLRKLDEVVSLHQRRLDLQKKVKAYFLQNMFPDEGESVPKIRFKGFTDDWDQRKLDAVFSFLKNNTFSRADLNYESGLYKNIHYGDVLIKYGETIDVSKEKIPYINKALTVPSDAILRNGDIVMADTAEDETVGKCTEIVGAVDNKLVAGLHTIPLRPKQRFAQGYFGFYLNSEKYHNQLRPLMQGIKVTSISKSALRDTLVKFPQTEQEQSKIGMFFIRLDNIITLQQQKIEQLQSLKKFLLQNMFC